MRPRFPRSGHHLARPKEDQGLCGRSAAWGRDSSVLFTGGEASHPVGARMVALPLAALADMVDISCREPRLERRDRRRAEGRVSAADGAPHSRGRARGSSSAAVNARARGRQHAGRLRSSTTGRWAAGARHAVGDARHGSHRDHRSGARSRRMRGDEGRRDPAAATGAGGDVRAVGRSVVLPVGANRRLLPGRRRDRRRAPLHRRHVRGAVVR